MSEGVREGVQRMCNLKAEDLEALKQRVASMVTTDWAGVWASGLKMVHLPWLLSVISIFQSSIEERDHSAAITTTTCTSNNKISSS